MPIKKIRTSEPYKNTVSISNVNMLGNFTSIVQPPESQNVAVPAVNADRPQKVEVVT
jgi:hypothetical protein